ncbi:MAG: ribonuclease III [Lachnospiraceae bacterium]|nr:ribonuclease III [Lachnospiraceae bacterium]
MEKGLSSIISESFGIEKKDLNTYSPLTLAYIGDVVFDIVIRTAVVCHGNTRANLLHRSTAAVVKATSQSEMMDIILPHLTEEEEAVYRRGRNAKSKTTAKNAPVVDYRKATGLEALMGYLYLDDRMERILELIKIGLEEVDVPWNTKN